jgi:nucleotide-binding universal stress UspA family protein
MYTRMLVPLDGSKIAETVLPYARFIADRFNLPVELLAALDIAGLGTHISVGQSRFLSTLVEDTMQSSEAYLKRIAHTFAGADVKRTVEKGRAADIIVDKARADGGMLIAMATHGRSGLNRWMLGSVAEKVLRGSTNPLLLIRAIEHSKPDRTVFLKSLIVPLDGSELAESVFPTVAACAKNLDLAVILFRSYIIPYAIYGYGNGYYAINVEQLTAEMADDARTYLEEKVAEIKTLGVERVSCVAKEGLSADEIIKLAHETPDSLIAMCSHGRSGMKRWALGSVTETVVRHSDAPVLILRPTILSEG